MFQDAGDNLDILEYADTKLDNTLSENLDKSIFHEHLVIPLPSSSVVETTAALVSTPTSVSQSGIFSAVLSLVSVTYGIELVNVDTLDSDDSELVDIWRAATVPLQVDGAADEETGDGAKETGGENYTTDSVSNADLTLTVSVTDEVTTNTTSAVDVTDVETAREKNGIPSVITI